MSFLVFCSKEVTKSVKNNINQYNFAATEESRPDFQLKKLSTNSFWMRHCKEP